MKFRIIYIIILLLVITLYALGILKPVPKEYLSKLFTSIDWTADVFAPFIIGIVTSGVSAFLWYKGFTKWLRPRLSVDPEFVRTLVKGKVVYHFKVINHTNVELYGVTAELHSVSSVNSGNGSIGESTRIELTRSDPMYLTPFDKNATDKPTECAGRFVTEVDLKKVWNSDNTELRLIVHCTHSKSNLGKVYCQKYKDKKVTMKTGAYIGGNSFEKKLYDFDIEKTGKDLKEDPEYLI